MLSIWQFKKVYPSHPFFPFFPPASYCSPPRSLRVLVYVYMCMCVCVYLCVKIPWRRAWQPTPVFLPGESHGQRSLAGNNPWGCKKSDATELNWPDVYVYLCVILYACVCLYVCACVFVVCMFVHVLYMCVGGTCAHLQLRRLSPLMSRTVSKSWVKDSVLPVRRPHCWGGLALWGCVRTL